MKAKLSPSRTSKEKPSFHDPSALLCANDGPLKLSRKAAVHNQPKAPVRMFIFVSLITDA
jgi:hypothetical protein